MKIDRLKYRWYSKQYKKVCEVNSIEPNNGFVNFQLDEYNDISTAIKDDNGYLLECTGLKDRNGNLKNTKRSTVSLRPRTYSITPNDRAWNCGPISFFSTLIGEYLK